MDHQGTSGRRALVGLAAMTFGAVAIVVGLTTPASAHDTEDEPEPAPGGASCLELGPEDSGWTETRVEVTEDGTTTHLLTDRGTESAEDDAFIDVTINYDLNVAAFESDIPIDAIYVEGTSDDEENSYWFWYTEDGSDEVSADHDLQTPEYNDHLRSHYDQENLIKSISFCWDEEGEEPPPTEPSTTESPTTSESTTTTESPSTTESPTTSSSVEVTTSVAPTTAPPTSAVSDDELPQTGSNSTGILVAVGAGLLVAGGVLVFSTRQYWRRRFT